MKSKINLKSIAAQPATTGCVTFIGVILFLVISGESLVQTAVSYGLDSGKYWTMAENIRHGLIHDIQQWWLWSLGFPVMLAGIQAMFEALHIEPLWGTHILFAALHATGAALVHSIAFRLSESKWRAAAAGIAFGLYPPLVQLQLFVMSEHVAIPLFLASVWIAMRRPVFIGRTMLAGTLFGIAFLARPALGPAGIVLAGCIYLPRAGLKTNAVRMAALAGTFALFVATLAGLERFASDGRIQGISPNAGVAYLIAMCHPAGYAFTCPECRTLCPRNHVAPQPAYMVRQYTFQDFMDEYHCYITKGGAGATAKIHGIGDYYIFNTPPWEADVPTDAARQCVENMTGTDYTKRLLANASSLLFSVDNLSVYRPAVSRIAGTLFVLLNLIVICIGAGSAVRTPKRDLITFSLAASALVPIAMSPFLISVSRYLYPFVGLYLALATLPKEDAHATK